MPLIQKDNPLYIVFIFLNEFIGRFFFLTNLTHRSDYNYKRICICTICIHFFLPSSVCFPELHGVCRKPWHTILEESILDCFLFLEHNARAISQNGLMGNCSEIARESTKKRTHSISTLLFVFEMFVCRAFLCCLF